MYYRIKDARYESTTKATKLLVDFWVVPEDRFLGLPPALSNDFVFANHGRLDKEQITSRLRSFGKRALYLGLRGPHTSLSLGGEHLSELIGLEGESL